MPEQRELPSLNTQKRLLIEISTNLALVVEGCKTKNSIKEVLDSLKIEDKSKNEILNLLRSEIKSLYERGHIYVLLPEEK